MPAPVEWRPARVVATRELAPDIREIEIAPEGALEPAASGAHLKIALTLDGRADTRSYSIVETTAQGYRIAVKRLPESRGGSAYMHGLTPGARLDVAGPHNHFALNPSRPDYLLVAGGIGITPIFAHARALERSSAKFRVVYGARSRADLAFAGKLAAAVGDRLEIFVSS
jgi:ferredoxin-NADP reductase